MLLERGPELAGRAVRRLKLKLMRGSQGLLQRLELLLETRLRSALRHFLFLGVTVLETLLCLSQFGLRAAGKGLLELVSLLLKAA